MNNGWCTGVIFSRPSHRACLALRAHSPEKHKKITPVLQAINQGKYTALNLHFVI